MNTLTAAVFACVVVLASAKPSGWLGYGHGHGHLPLVGASGVVSSNGAAGPTGVVTGHGAVGPDGIPNAHGHHGVAVLGHGLVGHVGHVGHLAHHGHDDGQWHGEGLLDSQDWAGHHGGAILGHHGGAILGHGAVVGHHAAVIAPHHAAVIAPAVHAVHGVHGIHGLAHGHGHGTVVAGPSGTIVADGHHGHVVGHHGLW